MLFTSYAFLCLFLPLTLLGFASARRFGPRAPTVWMVFVSVLFYAAWNPAWLPILAVSVLGNFGLIHLCARFPDRGWIVAVAIAANLGALVGFKLVSDVTPLGISFFTFTQIACLLDCREDAVAGDRPPPGLLDYAILSMFFPHLIAGPVLRAREVLPTLSDTVFSSRNLAIGLFIFTIGLLKKTLVADPLGAVVNPAFADPDGLSTLAAWHAALGWVMQLYFDFSGYSDMAIGLARMFNLRYPANFDSPYKARCIIDYWQRWHMSLTRFLTASIYTPIAMAAMRARRTRGLPTNRRGQQTVAGFTMLLAVPIVATMALAGLWHGFTWNYLIFGLLHAGFLCVNHGWRLFRPVPTTARLAPAALTFLCIVAAAVIFRAPSLAVAGTILGAMGGLSDVPITMTSRTIADIGWLGLACALAWGAPNTARIVAQVEPGSATAFGWRPSLPWAVAFGSAATLSLLSAGGTREFLYFQF